MVASLMDAAFLKINFRCIHGNNFLITSVYLNYIFREMANYLQDAQSHKLQTKHQ